MARILVAASPEPRAIVERILAGHELSRAETMAQAEQFLHERTFDLIIGTIVFDESRMFDLLRLVKGGLPYWTIERFQQNTSLPLEHVLDLIGVPRRTLTRRKREGRFRADESDRLLRASRVFGQVFALFDGDRDAATEWLISRQPALGGATPLDLAGSEVGALEVQRLVGRLEHGVFS